MLSSITGFATEKGNLIWETINAKLSDYVAHLIL